MKVVDESQKPVVEAMGGRHLVLAPPGCGKTYVLAERVAYALGKGVATEDMLCLTFTNRAARGMKERISGKLPDKLTDNLYVGNVHGYCSRFLFENAVVPSDSSIIDDDDTRSIIRSFIGTDNSGAQDFRLKREYDIVMFTAHFIHQVENGHDKSLFLHPECLTIEDRSAFRLLCNTARIDTSSASLLDICNNIDFYQQMADDMKTSGAAEVKRLVRKLELAMRYNKYKNDNHLIDFEDMLLYTYDTYKRHDSRCRYYSWLQVDEVQDLNAMQVAIIDLLVSDADSTVVYLGDEQQAIFSFMGAKLDILERIKEKCGGNLHRLLKNHRSPAYLLNVFNDYAEGQLHIDRSLLPEPFLSDNDTGKDRLFILPCLDIEEETARATSLAQRLVESCQKETTAIVVLSNKDADAISDRMVKDGIKHFKVSGSDMFSSNTMKTLLAHLDVMRNDNSFISWARIMTTMGKMEDESMGRRFVKKLRDLAMTPSDFIVFGNNTYTGNFLSLYDTVDMVVFDTETTGTDVFSDDIIELSAIRVRQGKMTGEALDIYIRTDRQVPEMLGEKENPLFGIYKEKEQTGELVGMAEAVEAFMEFCGDSPLVGHNVNFDYRILENNVMRRIGVESRLKHQTLEWMDTKLSNAKIVDTLKLTRLLEPGMQSYKLESLVSAFSLEGENTHKAIDDVVATFSLMRLCASKARSKIEEQMEFLTHGMVVPIINRLRANYSELYLETQSQLCQRSADKDGMSMLAKTLCQSYIYMVDNKLLGEEPKIHAFINYIESDMMDEENRRLSLMEQLSQHAVTLNTMKESDFCNSGSLGERLFVTTVHKAKGLEFDNVIVFDAVAGRYPNYYNKSKKSDEEDARKFYVALSRSKKRLIIAYSLFTSYNNNSRKQKEITPFMSNVIRYFNTIDSDKSLTIF